MIHGKYHSKTASKILHSTRVHQISVHLFINIKDSIIKTVVWKATHTITTDNL